MGQYYYLLSSLPFLDFQMLPPLTYSELAALSTPWLSKHGLSQFHLARIDIENVEPEQISQPMLKRWILFEHGLRNALVHMRAEKLGKPAEPHLRPHIEGEFITLPDLQCIATAPSPYAAELALLEARWHFLTIHEVGHHFDFTALIIYALKLQILERKNKFEIERGQQVFQGLIEAKLQDDAEHGNHNRG
jgi:hypothetical protein